MRGVAASSAGFTRSREELQRDAEGRLAADPKAARRGTHICVSPCTHSIQADVSGATDGTARMASTSAGGVFPQAEALVQLAYGTTYRQAARRARRRALQRGAEVSADGRTAGDWVSMYAPILQEQLLLEYPKYASWPEVLVLDSAPFHGRARFANGRPKPSGRYLFSVLGALFYARGTVDDAHAPG